MKEQQQGGGEDRVGADDSWGNGLRDLWHTFGRGILSFGGKAL
jgi:hypothetical protein